MLNEYEYDDNDYDECICCGSFNNINPCNERTLCEECACPFISADNDREDDEIMRFWKWESELEKEFEEEFIEEEKINQILYKKNL